MAIMVAGGMTFAVPGMMPVAYAANENLIVSAENSQFENYMAGPQVIEVVISDSDIRETDESKGNPTVTVNGQDLQMVQATDGQWYGYFADKAMATAADNTAKDTPGKGLDFGTICPTGLYGDVSFSDADGVAINGNGTDNCSTFAFDDDVGFNVLREPKNINPGTLHLPDGTVKPGQIGLNPDYWPIIQLYTFATGGNVVVQYDKGGGVQSTTLTFDTVDGLDATGIELDRTIYPPGSQVHATVTDTWLNIDPTDEDSWSWSTDPDSGATYYQVFDESGTEPPPGYDQATNTITTKDISGVDLMQVDAVLKLNPNAQNRGSVVDLYKNTDALEVSAAGNNITDLVTLTEQGPNTGVFGTYDEADDSIIRIVDKPARGTSAIIDYNDSPISILAGYDSATIEIQPGDDTWNSGESIPIVVVDGDQNKNSRSDEDLTVDNPDALIPTLVIGDPFTIGDFGHTVATIQVQNTSDSSRYDQDNLNYEVELFSERAIIDGSSLSSTINEIAFTSELTLADLRNSLVDVNQNTEDQTGYGFNFLNYDLRSLGAETVGIRLGGAVITGGAAQNYLPINNYIDSDTNNIFANPSDKLEIAFYFDPVEVGSGAYPVVVDFFSFGFTDDGVQASERFANQIIRIEAEESGDNTSTFEGALEYVMVNQINIQEEATFAGITTIADDPTFIVMEDYTDEDDVRVTYNDLGSDGVDTPVSDQEAAPSHSGVVSLNQDSYKIADTVVITLEDADLNVDSDLIDIFTVVDEPGPTFDTVGSAKSQLLSFGELGRMLDVTFDDIQWTTPVKETCTSNGEAYVQDDNETLEGTGVNTGLGNTGFTLIETGTETGVFEGDFQIPAYWCPDSDRENDLKTYAGTTGLDIEVNYVDFRDASGEIIEVGDSAGVRANTGSVSLDRTVYPVPFGKPIDFDPITNSHSPVDRSVFPIHQTGMLTGGTYTDGLDDGEYLANGDLTVHIRVNDPDFDVNPSGEDSIAQNVAGTDLGPVKISVSRGADTVILGYAGGPTASGSYIEVEGVESDSAKPVRQFGPISEIAPDAGIYELDLPLRYTDGPADTQCPDTKDSLIDARFSYNLSDLRSGEDFCILQGDILQVEYTDPADASGDPNTVTDSATFDLRNGVLQSDKSVYIIGSDMILTLIEPDLDLDNDAAETYDLDLIEWDSDAGTLTMGDIGGEDTAFDPEPTDFRETGDSTGIFQIVIEVPEALGGDRLERGEEILLEYTDWGPSGSDYVGDEDEDVNLTVYTSNFGATIELDQKIYTWTDKVYITIVAPDHNFDADLVDEIGDTDLDPIKVSTRNADIDNYKLVETGTDTGIFTGEVILTGFKYDADGDTETGDEVGNDVDPSDAHGGDGPTDGLLPARDDDGLSISFEFSEKETVVASALIRWNIGEVQWLEASYPASGTGVVRIIDPDMNLNPEAVDNFEVDVWSDSDSGGIGLTVTETNEATGIFEGTVFFTVTDVSTGHRLRVAEGDTVTASYDDYTLPEPYDTGDSIDVKATSLIGTVVPPLERAPVANLKTVDSFGNTLDSVSVDQQVQISADLANGQDKDQLFAYLVQIQDANGVTVSLSWIDGELTPGQSFSPAVSWIPADSGAYTATAFVWESVTNPTALSPPLSTTINVS